MMNDAYSITGPAVRFEMLIENHHDEIFHYLWRLLHSAHRSDSAVEAQDLTQEVFLRAYRAFSRLRRDSNHRAWLYRIATNCANTSLKRSHPLIRDNVPFDEEFCQIAAGTGQSPDHQVILGETLDTVGQAIASLPPKQRAAVVLRHLQGLSYPEIAQALDCSEESARANVYQGLRRLRGELGDDFP